MNSRIALVQLVAYSIQVGLVLAIAIPLGRSVKSVGPKVRLAYFQFLFGLAIALPCLGLLGPVPAKSWENSTSEINIVLTDVLNLTSPTPAPWASAVLALLAAGAVVFLVRMARSWALLRSLHSASVPLEPISGVFSPLTEKLGISAEVRASADLQTPISFGLRRKVIIVPAGFQQLDEACRQAILCHELLHLKRWDWPLALAEQVVRSLLWFHPAIHFLVDSIQLAREETVDFETVRITRKRRDYLETLRLAAESLRHPAMPSTVSFARRSHLHRRVAKLKQEVHMSKKRELLSSSLLSGRCHPCRLRLL